MSLLYRTKNKFIRYRRENSRFGKTTLQDIGGAVCEQCHKLFFPDYGRANVYGFIDPRIMRDCGKTCPQCGGQGKKAQILVLDGLDTISFI